MIEKKSPGFFGIRGFYKNKISFFYLNEMPRPVVRTLYWALV